MIVQHHRSKSAPHGRPKNGAPEQQRSNGHQQQRPGSGSAHKSPSSSSAGSSKFRGDDSNGNRDERRSSSSGGGGGGSFVASPFGSIEDIFRSKGVVLPVSKEKSSATKVKGGNRPQQQQQNGRRHSHGGAGASGNTSSNSNNKHAQQNGSSTTPVKKPLSATPTPQKPFLGKVTLERLQQGTAELLPNPLVFHKVLICVCACVCICTRMSCRGWSALRKWLPVSIAFLRSSIAFPLPLAVGILSISSLHHAPCFHSHILVAD